MRTPKLQRTVEQPLAGECWIPLKKLPHVWGQRRSPKAIVGEVKSCLESNLIHNREAQRAPTKPCVHQDPGTPQETEPHLPFSVWVSSMAAYVSSFLPWEQGLWLQQTWEVWCVSPTIEPPSRQLTNWRTIKQLYQRSSHTVVKVLGPTTDFPTWESSKETENPQGMWFWRPVGFDYRTYTGLGKQTLGGHKQNLVCTRTQEKGAVTPQENEPDLPVSIQEIPAEAWVNSGLLWVRGTESNSPGISSFEGLPLPLS